MKKILTICTICMYTATLAQGSAGTDDVFTESFIPSAKASESWAKMSNVTSVSFASSNLRYAKDIMPAASLQKTWTATAWKGEKVHTQILVWTKEDISGITYSLTELKNEKNKIIPAGNIQAGFVRYVITDEFAGGCGYRKPQDFDSSIVADVIDTISQLSLKSKNVQPLWLTIDVPADAEPGKYSGSIKVNAGKVYTLDYNILIKNRVLPPAAEWKFDLDLWQHPAAIARVHNVELWSDKHFEYMRSYYTMLAKAGQKCITASIINEPWGHQTYDDFPSLIQWIKQKDGSWQYDYTLFDKYIAFVMDCGIKQRINCYSMVPWALSFSYFDEATGRDSALKAEVGTAEYNLHWTNMLRDFTQHLKTKGWFDITTIAMDERPMKSMQMVITILKTIDKNWKVALAGNYHPQIEKYIYDYCVASNLSFPEAVRKRRIAEGRPSTYYTCCSENYPNGFTFSPPAEHVWIGWYAAAKGFTGYLRWAYNSWVADPLTDSRFKAWPAGDTYQVYPGPRTSIRFEKLIEGIQDFEKINILRDEYTKTGNTAALKKLEAVLNNFDIQKLKTIPAQQMTDPAKAILNE
ncbi:MAG: DUF4091 domain-containing protein [Chitinophagaceae bacterium]|nr:DUF4091 domain-containing protein [Chitinophagaceae bacterium]